MQITADYYILTNDISAVRHVESQTKPEMVIGNGEKANIYPLSLRSAQSGNVTSSKYDAEQPVGKQHPEK